MSHATQWLAFGALCAALGAGCGGGGGTSGPTGGQPGDVWGDSGRAAPVSPFADSHGGSATTGPSDAALFPQDGGDGTVTDGAQIPGDGGGDIGGPVGFDASDGSETDGGPTIGGFGYPCQDGNACLSSFCVPSELGDVCTITCIGDEDCPTGWTCESASAFGVDQVFICLSRFANLCKPCGSSADCQSNPNSADGCVDFDGNGYFCGVACSDDSECPDGYTCQAVTLQSGTHATQCVPVTGECTCRPEWIASGLSTACYQTNEYGTCTGERVCTDNGLTPCTAQTPALEECNDIDDNCDGETDPVGSAGCTNYWEDADGDGYGVGDPVCACAPPTEKSVTAGGDCNDQVPTIKPGADESCNGLDDDCDGDTDEEGALGCTQYFVDADDDGWGDTNLPICLCTPQDHTATVGGDCDDHDATIHPQEGEATVEVCDGIDNDCDGQTDEEDAEGCTPYFFDSDGDQYGVADEFRCLCSPDPPYTALQPGDCDDSDPDVYPFHFEFCNGIDDDCNGQTDDGAPEDICGVIDFGVSACIDGQCVVGSCDPGHYDVDGNADNGCECAGSAVENSGPTCDEAVNVGTVSDAGQTIGDTTVQGIVILPDESDWYSFYAPDGPDNGGCDSYHVRIRFLWNPNGSYRFDIYKGGCAPANGVCMGSQDFEWFTNFYADDPTPDNRRGECPCTAKGPDAKGHSATSPGVQVCTDNSDHYWVRVYRNQDSPLTCDFYQLEISNGVY